MRVDVSPRQVEVSPGVPLPVAVTIANDTTVIGGYTVRVLGADPSWLDMPSGELSLFPDESRTLTVTITPPRGIPAGSRRVAVQVRELTPPHATSITDLDLRVPEAHDVQLRVDPLAVTAGRRARFSLLVENTGNSRVLGELAGQDTEDKVRFAFDPDRVDLAPGEHVLVDMFARAKRPFTGTPTVRMLEIFLDEQRPDRFFDRRPPAVPAERAPLANATFVQRSVLSRTAWSLAGLLAAVTVFAIVITVALSRLVSQSTADRNLALQIASARNSTTTTGTSGLSGRVTLLTSHAPESGVAVDVFQASDTTDPIATTATNPLGMYTVSNLAAGKYVVSFRGAGFVQIWYPGAATPASATPVTVTAGQIMSGINVALGGVPATITGTVSGTDVSGATLFLEQVPQLAAAAPADLRATALATSADPTGSGTAGGGTTGSGTAGSGTTPGSTPVPPPGGGAVVQTVPIGSDGTFTLDNVPSPSTYDLVVSKTGYAVSTQLIDVGAGETRSGVLITLRQGNGVINGSVSSPAGRVGGVTVVATAGQSTANTVSLTGASVGDFSLQDLPTPATFTVVATAPGFTSQSLTVTLSSGQKLSGLAITLTPSSGSLQGVVTEAPSGTAAAGVSVSVTDGQIGVDTVSAANGSWSVTGLQLPDTYTVTLSRADLASQTVSVSLDAAGDITQGSLGAATSATGISVRLQPATAIVTGIITQPGGGTVCDGTTHALGEASVTLQSGTVTYTTTSASISPNCGVYRLEQVPPGTYTLTVAAGSGTSPSSQVLTLGAGTVLNRPVNLASPASISGTVGCCTDPSVGTPGPRAGWTVFLYEEGQYPTTVLRTTTTGAGGTFSFADVNAGRYILAAGPTADPTDATNTLPVTVQPSKARTGVVITVSQ